MRFCDRLLEKVLQFFRRVELLAVQGGTNVGELFLSLSTQTLLESLTLVRGFYAKGI